MTQTTASCRTTGGNAGDMHRVVMSFDGSERQSEDEFTYQPNPEIFDVQPRSSIQRYKDNLSDHISFLLYVLQSTSFKQHTD